MKSGWMAKQKFENKSVAREQMYRLRRAGFDAYVMGSFCFLKLTYDSQAGLMQLTDWVVSSI